jgi:hypothetical protein
MRRPLLSCGILFGAASLLAQTWKLPPSAPLKESGPRTYRFTVVYNTANRIGEIVQRQRLTGEYTRGLGDRQVSWKNVMQAEADGASAPFGTDQRRDFMEGFRYRDDLAGTMKPDFFKVFPPSAVFERNLIWDTGMIEDFGQNYFDHLELNKPYKVAADQSLKMQSVGTFNNHNVTLTWLGNSKRNGQDCALIQYQAFFNPLEISNAGMNMKARSDYWGDIWVSLATRQIEYATLYENVAGEMKITGQDAPQPINVFRMGTFEPMLR